MLLGALLLAPLAATVVASVVAPHYVEHERRDHVGHNTYEWIKTDRLHPDHPLPFRVGLTQQNLDKGHDLLMDLSDPNSDRYGQHWTEDEVIDYFAPHEDTIKVVHEWLVNEGKFHPDRISHSTNKQWLQVDVTVKELEDLLKTEYHVHHHRENGKRGIAADRYHVPRHIRDHIDYVTPGVRLLEVTERKRSVSDSTRNSRHTNIINPARLTNHLQNAGGADSDAHCDRLITPSCLRKLYNFTQGTSTMEGNSLGLFNNGQQAWNQNGLDGFYTQYTNGSIPNGTSLIDASIDGGKTRGYLGGEAAIDIDCAMPIVYPQNITFYNVDDVHYGRTGEYYGTFNNWLDAVDGSYCNHTAFGLTGNSLQPNPNMPEMDAPYPDKHKNGYKGELQCGKFKPTNVLSVSQSTTEFYTPLNYQRRQCQEFLKLGLQGVSVIMSSGDDGVAAGRWSEDDGCLWSAQDINDEQHNFPFDHSNSRKKTVFNPGFPVTCPYITTVGATWLPKGSPTDPTEETAPKAFGSGGGFSNIYPIPDYQKEALETYFRDSAPPYPYYETTYNRSFSPNGGLYNRAGRGYPDVSANGMNTAVWILGALWRTGGTSASAPIFAALVTRINEERIKCGKGPVGFINPTLYKNPQVMHDITKGNNPGCHTDGFEAVKGWDPVTGLGTPNFPAMVDLFLSLP